VIGVRILSVPFFVSFSSSVYQVRVRDRARARVAELSIVGVRDSILGCVVVLMVP